MSRLETHPMILLEAPPSNHPVYACPLSILPPDQFQYRAQLTIKYHIQTAAPITYVQGGCHPDPLKCERSQRVDLDWPDRPVLEASRTLQKVLKPNSSAAINHRTTIHFEGQMPTSGWCVRHVGHLGKPVGTFNPKFTKASTLIKSNKLSYKNIYELKQQIVRQ